jgi:hypothetical protein
VLKGLLRIMSSEREVQDRFVGSGGLAVLFKLLQPQVGWRWRICWSARCPWPSLPSLPSPKLPHP